MGAAFKRAVEASADDEITVQRRAAARESSFDLFGIDDPFCAPSPGCDDDDAVLPPYLAYLSAQQIPDQYLPQFEAEALAFRTRFRLVPLEELGDHALGRYLEEARTHALSDRALRNRRVACEAFVGFLRQREVPLVLQSAFARPLRAAPEAADEPAENRRHVRVTFVAEVYVDSLGVLRCADLSIGGMYVETFSSIGTGTILRAHFKLSVEDPKFISVTARVAFAHPHLGAGIEFIKISAGDVKRIADFVAVRSSSR